MIPECVRKFYRDEHARQFLRVGTEYQQVEKYRRMDDLARRRDVPAGFYRDEAHYLESIRAGGNANRAVLATRRATAQGLSRMGYSHERIMRAMNATSAEVDELMKTPPLHDPHMGRELATDAGEEPPGLREFLNRSGDSDGHRTIVYPRPQAVHRRNQ
jgi:hypothetical protein